MTYDGFISYSHAADDLLAPRLQAGLQRFAKPWWKRRAVRIFRDESSLSANPHLWSSITEALDTSGWFVLLLSPDAARSEWVNQEIAYWVANRDPGRILPVATDGEFGWAGGDVSGSAVPDRLRGVFTEEPRWVDLRAVRGEEQLDLKNPTFLAGVADVASAIRGIPKDDLASEEVRQHRRTVRTAWAAGIGLGVLAIVAVMASVFAVGQRNEAQTNATLAEQNAALAVARELAASAVNLLDEDPELSILLTLEAIAATPEGQDQPGEVIDALWQAVQEDRLVTVVETGYDVGVFVTLSPDDSTLYVVNGFPVGGWPTALSLQAYSTADFELLWEYQAQVGDIFDPESEGDYQFLFPHVSPSGDLVSLGLVGNPARFLVFDAMDGTQVFEGLYPSDCRVPLPGGWSPDGSTFVVTGTCPREGVEGPFWAEILDGETFAPVALVGTGNVSNVSFDDTGRLFLFAPDEGVTVLDPPDYTTSTFVDGVRGRGDVSADGSTLVTFSVPSDPCQLRLPIPRPSDCGTLASYDAATGERIDLLTPLPAVPARDGLMFGFSGADRLFAVGTEGAETIVFDIATGDQVFSLPSGPGVNAAVTSDGRRAFTGHRGGVVKVWDLSPNVGRDQVGDLGTYSAVSANTFTPAQSVGAFVAVDPGTFESRVFFYDVATGTLVGEPVAGQQPITPLADDRFLITGPYVGAPGPSSWFVYDPVTGDRARIAGCDPDVQTGLCPNGAPPPTYFWASSVDGSQLLRQGDGQFTLIDPSDGAELGQLSFQGQYQYIGGFSDEAVSGSAQGQFVAEDRSTGEELARLPDAGGRFEGSPDGAMVAFYKTDSIAMVDLVTWEIWEFPIDLGRVQGLAVDAGLRRLALGDENGIHAYDIDTGELVASIPVPGIADLSWIDEDRVLVATRTGTWATVSLLTDDLIASAKSGLTRGFTPAECEIYRIDPCPRLNEIRER